MIIPHTVKEYATALIQKIPVTYTLLGLVQQYIAKKEIWCVLAETTEEQTESAELPALRKKMVAYAENNEVKYAEYDHLTDISYSINDYPELVKNTCHSFFTKTMQDLGLTEELNDTGISVTSAIYGHPITANRQLVHADEHDNIIFNYYYLDGTEYDYDNGNKTNSRKLLHSIRYKHPKSFTELGKTEIKKYHRFRLEPFFLPNILQAIQKESKIDTLYFVEGEKKAIAGWLHGFYMVGLGGIHGFYDKENKGQINQDIQKCIEKLNPEEIVFLTDADTLTVNYAPDKDLFQRVNSFKTAIVNFRESLGYALTDKNNRLSRITFMHLKTSFCKDAKGLDDLFLHYAKDKELICHDLAKTSAAKRYFTALDLTSLTEKAINKHFGLSNPKDFYDSYKDCGFEKEPFVFKHIKYQYNPEKQELDRVKHLDSEIFLFIGDKCAKMVHKPLFGGTTEVDIAKFGVGEVKRRYGKHFLSTLLCVDGLTIEPATNYAYKRIIKVEKDNHHFDYLNLYEPINHEIKEGEFPNTVKYLKHLFGGNATLQKDILGDPFTIAIDWLTILYQKPKQFLPVILLLSKEQETGKTTMIDWLHAIYETNLISMKMEQFIGNFNSHWAFKLIRCIDEGSLDLERGTAKNTFKNLTTAKNIQVELKGIDVTSIPNYGKMIICSNDENNVMKMESEDSRFFPVKVTKLPEKDNHFLEKLRAEIPAWLHFIANRQIAHPAESRLWFRTEYLKTEQFRKIVEKTKSNHELEIDYFVKDAFLTFKFPEIRYTIKFLLETINKRAKFKVSETQMRDYLEKKGYVKHDGNSTIKIPIDFGELHSDVIFQTATGRFFRFYYTQWLSEEEIEEFNKPRQTEKEFVPTEQKDLQELQNQGTTYKMPSQTEEVPF